MSYLIDTTIVSELRKAEPHPNVAAWFQRNKSADAYLSVLVVGELRQAIERVRQNQPDQADLLERWLSGLLVSYGDRLLPVTPAIAQEWGRLNILPQPLSIMDGLMAATARVHRLTLVTRNVDVARTGVAAVNPFDSSAG